MKKVETTLKEFLEGYKGSFKEGFDIDELWTAKDVDKNGYLDKGEAQLFLDELSK